MDSTQQKETDFELVVDSGTKSVGIGEPTHFKDAEWCFQFFDNEPVVFAWSVEGLEQPTPLVIQLQPHSNEGITFTQQGMKFRIFPREISEETKEQRRNENESKNKETTSESSNS